LVVVNNINNDMMKKIKNYENEIKSLEGFHLVVRRTPARYIGGVGNKGFLNLFREILQNSLDEIMKKNSLTNVVRVSFDVRTLASIIQDTGRGIPFAKMIKIFTDDKTSSNYEKQKGEFSSGAHGTGSTIANALCTLFMVESFITSIDDKTKTVEYNGRKITFDNFIPTTPEPEVIENPQLQGTRVTFIPSTDVLGMITIDHKEIIHMIRSLLPLTDIGTTVEFSYIDKNGKAGREIITNKDGILSILISNTKSPLMMPISIKANNGDVMTDILLTYDTDENEGESVISFSNYCHTVYGGTHVDGFMEGIRKFFKNYMNKIYLKNNAKLSISNADISSGLKAVVSVLVLDPQFTSQSKDALGNPEIVDYMRDLVYDSLEEWSKRQPNDLQKACKYLKGMAEIRLKSEAGKVKMNKFTASTITGLPAKYDAPSDMSLPGLEFIMCEGDSAAGKARTNKGKNQGILPLRGKISNAFTTTREMLLANTEVQAIINIIGAGYGRSFDISKCRYEKIIIMADADPKLIGA